MAEFGAVGVGRRLLLRRAGALASHRAALTGVVRGALIVWALEELLHGVNPFRRLLGAVVLTVQLAALALQARIH